MAISLTEKQIFELIVLGHLNKSSDLIKVIEDNCCKNKALLPDQKTGVQNVFRQFCNKKQRNGSVYKRFKADTDEFKKAIIGSGGT